MLGNKAGDVQQNGPRERLKIALVVGDGDQEQQRSSAEEDLQSWRSGCSDG